MCSRNIHGGLDNPLISSAGWTIDDFKKIMTPEVLSQIKSFYFCGNFGDPILNNDLIKMCEYAKEVAPGMTVRVHTNGSARSASWWKQLANSLPGKNGIVFALDGLADTHSIYRIGTDFDTIIKNAKIVINEGIEAEWVFIKFKHNEHQVEEARQLAAELGFTTFTVKNSARFLLEPQFPVLNKQGETIYHLEPASTNQMVFIDKKVIENYKQVMSTMTIDCHAAREKEIYIDAYKNVFPCCWLSSIPYNYIEDNPISDVRYAIRDEYADLMNTLGSVNALDRSIKDIIDSDAWQTCWEEYWTNKKLITCARTCGRSNVVSFAQPRDQKEDV
jgi:MoaA/NifB/PqqE/SkfB family radical SAM enzyme